MPQNRFPQRQSNPESRTTHGQSQERGGTPKDARNPPPRSPVRPTLLRHMKHLFFLGLGVSAFPSSLLDEARGAGMEAAGWFTTKQQKRKRKGRVRNCGSAGDTLDAWQRRSDVLVVPDLPSWSFLLLRKPLQAPLSADCRAAYF